MKNIKTMLCTIMFIAISALVTVNADVKNDVEAQIITPEILGTIMDETIDPTIVLTDQLSNNEKIIKIKNSLITEFDIQFGKTMKVYKSQAFFIPTYHDKKTNKYIVEVIVSITSPLGTFAVTKTYAGKWMDYGQRL